MAHSISWLEQTVIIKFSGTIGISELHSTYSQLNADPQSAKPHKRIVNFLGVKKLELKDLDIKVFAFKTIDNSTENPNISIALVMRPGYQHKGIDFYIDMLKQGPWSAARFNTVNEALQWQPDL